MLPNTVTSSHWRTPKNDEHDQRGFDFAQLKALPNWQLVVVRGGVEPPTFRFSGRTYLQVLHEARVSMGAGDR
jgi:hypothetical protein